MNNTRLMSSQEGQKRFNVFRRKISAQKNSDSESDLTDTIQPETIRKKREERRRKEVMKMSKTPTLELDLDTDTDDTIIASDWVVENRDNEEVQNIPLDHDNQEGSEKEKPSTIVAFGQLFGNGKQITTDDIIQIKDRLQSSLRTIDKEKLWLDVCCVNKDSANALQSVFGLHPLTIDDWFSKDVREKAALFADYFQITTLEYRYNLDTNILKTYTVCFI